MSIVQYKKIGSLSLLKFFLAFITFLFHMYIHFSVVYKAKLINKFICDGAFAMSGFFILSGFLLYYIYSQKSFSDFEYMKNSIFEDIDFDTAFEYVKCPEKQSLILPMIQSSIDDIAKKVFEHAVQTNSLTILEDNLLLDIFEI